MYVFRFFERRSLILSISLHCSSAWARSWVLLRNTHLCPEWLGGLEKKLRGLSLHPSFRLFLTSEVCSVQMLRARFADLSMNPFRRFCRFRLLALDSHSPDRTVAKALIFAHLFARLSVCKRKDRVSTPESACPPRYLFSISGTRNCVIVTALVSFRTGPSAVAA